MTVLEGFVFIVNTGGLALDILNEYGELMRSAFAFVWMTLTSSLKHPPNTIGTELEAVIPDILKGVPRTPRDVKPASVVIFDCELVIIFPEREVADTLPDTDIPPFITAISPPAI